MNNKDIIISIAADSRQFLSGIDTALKEAEKKFQTNNIPKAMKKTFKALGTEISSCQKQITDMLNAFSDSRLTDHSVKNMTKQLAVSLKSIQQVLKDLQTAHIEIDTSSSDNLKFLMLQLEDSMQSFSKQSSELQNTIRSTAATTSELASATLKLSGSAKKSSQNIKIESDTLKSAVAQVKNAEASTSSLATVSEVLAKGFGSLPSNLTKIPIIDKLIDLTKKMAASVAALDQCFTQMRLSSDKSVYSLKEFQEKSIILSNSIGTTSEKIQKSASVYLNLGYSLKQAEELVKNTTIFAHAGNMGNDQATQQMLTGMKTWSSEFRNEADASQAVIDRYTSIARTFGTTTDSLTNIAEQSASSFRKSGNDMNESLGLMVSSNLIGQNIGDTAAALELLTLRIKGAKSELSSMGYHVDDLSGSASDLRSEIRDLTGIDVMLDDSTYKSAAQIIQQIGVAYKDMETSEQNTLLQKLVGDGDTSAIENLLENYQTLTAVIETAINADGSALEANSIYLDSISGKTEQVKNSFQELSAVAIPDDFLKGILDATSIFLNALTEITSLLGPLPTLLATIGGISLFKNFGRLTKSPHLNLA